MKDYTKAIKYYEDCLSINNSNSTTYVSLGYAFHLQNDYMQAMNCYNKANFLKCEDPFIKTLIGRVLEDLKELSVNNIFG